MSESTASDLSPEDISRLVDAVTSGVPLAEVTGIGREALESLYTLGYNLYNAGDQESAETVFQALCLYDFNDPRFWMGLGATRQALEKYAPAIDAYSLAAIASALGDPEPIFHSGVCYLKLGDLETAAGAFEALETVADPARPDQAALAKKAAGLLEIIRRKKGDGA
jgi:type III secretion system low calcium response chaperone LcrH/SycD